MQLFNSLNWFNCRTGSRWFDLAMRVARRVRLSWNLNIELQLSIMLSCFALLRAWSFEIRGKRLARFGRLVTSFFNCFGCLWCFVHELVSYSKSGHLLVFWNVTACLETACCPVEKSSLCIFRPSRRGSRKWEASICNPHGFSLTLYLVVHREPLTLIKWILNWSGIDTFLERELGWVLIQEPVSFILGFLHKGMLLLDLLNNLLDALRIVVDSAVDNPDKTELRGGLTYFSFLRNLDPISNIFGWERVARTLGSNLLGSKPLSWPFEVF